jgi:ribosome biogenesis protein ENP2
MNVQKRNGISIYCLSAGSTIPEWLGDRARRNLSKTNESIRRRVELIQDFTMPASSSKLVQSNDGRYIVATGTYPPRIRCYDVNELSMKFERYVNAEIIDTVLLGDDYGKQALLLADRTIAFHAHYGAHESVRIPSFGRAMTYEPSTCELLVAAKGSNVYRINLDEGRFSEPWDFNNDRSEGNKTTVSGTSIVIHPRHALTAVGCDDGIVRLWDSRSSDTMLRPFLKLDVSTALSSLGYSMDPLHHEHYIHSSATVNEISSIAYDTSGLYMAVGTGGGLVALYDIRSSRPLHVQEHKHGSSIHTLRFHSSSGMVLSSDEKLIKIWRYKAASASDVQFSNIPEIESMKNDIMDVGRIPTNDSNDSSAIGSIKVNVEGNGKLTHFIIAGDEKDPTGERSGLILCATDQPKMDSFYIPAIGVAPKWCSYLENITEELEERDLKRDGSGIDVDDLLQSGQETVFENYKFVSRDDLEMLGISNLIGTPMLRGYMNGFFMDLNLYTRIRAVANPFEYEEYQKKKLKERLDAKQSTRIAPRVDKKKNQKPKVAVNPDLADRLANKAISESTKAGKVAKVLLSDNRFGSLFTNPDFEIDHDDTEFKLRNPSGLSAKNKRNNLDSDSENDDEESNDVVGDVGEIIKDLKDQHNDDLGHYKQLDGDVDSDSDDEDGFRGGNVRGEAYEDMKRMERQLHEQRKKERLNRTKTKQPVMYEEDDIGDQNGMVAISLGLGDASAQAKAQQRREEIMLPLSKRKAKEVEQNKSKPQIRIAGGSKEAIYYPKSSGHTNKRRKS